MFKSPKKQFPTFNYRDISYQKCHAYFFVVDWSNKATEQAARLASFRPSNGTRSITGGSIIGKMANLTENRNYTTAQTLHCVPRHYGLYEKTFILAANIPLSVIAFLGNILIIAALQKVSMPSLHSASRIMFRSLAITDLCVGLITQPLFVSYLISIEHSERCHYLRILLFTIGALFSAVSCLTLAAISADRLLALSLGLRYRHVVTLRRVRVIVIICWFYCGSAAVIFIYNEHAQEALASLMVLLCVLTSTFCYTKIYLKLRRHQAQVQSHVSQGQTNGGCIPLNIAWYKKTLSSALWVQLTLVVCYLPFGIAVAIFAITGLSTPSFDFAWDVSFSFLMLNSTLNPFLYCWKMKGVRKAVKDTVKKIYCSSS